MSEHARHAADLSLTAPRSRFYGGPFGRLFRNLPPWEPEGTSEAECIAHIRRLAEELQETNGGNPAGDNDRIPAGYTYLGQFIDHDITFDPASSLQRQNDPDRLVNFRTPRFDLDSLYGRGPADQPYLYRRDSESGRQRFFVAHNANGEPDLPRNSDASGAPAEADDHTRFRTALIGDARNDENIIVAQLQLAFLRLHNHFIDDGHTFEGAQRLTHWHYQWVVIHDFLKLLCDRRLVDRLLGDDDPPGEPNLHFYDPKHQAFMPVEFSAAAYRFGHSMIRGRYHLNDRLQELRGGEPLHIFGGAPADNLIGGRVLPMGWSIQWGRFVQVEGSPAPQLSRRIDERLAGPLAELPAFPETERSLAFRNIVRGWRLELPAGQDVARRMGVPATRVADPTRRDPLWVYILKEAARFREGRRLGPVGERIVAEVFVGLLARDPLSYYSVDPLWQPAAGEDFDLAALLKLAGAPLTAADIAAFT